MVPALLFEVNSRRQGSSQHHGLWRIVHIHTYLLTEKENSRGWGGVWGFYAAKQHIQRLNMCPPLVSAVNVNNKPINNTI